MKSLYIITYSTKDESNKVCEMLQKRLQNTAFPGCWHINTSEIAEETKENVIASICLAINHLVNSSEYKNIVFGLGVDRQSYIDEVLQRIETSRCDVKIISADEAEKLISQKI